MIEACRLLRERGVDFRCLLVGDGELRAALQAQIDQHGLTDHIVLLGRQPRQKVSELLNTSDVLVLPSIITSRGKKEGIPVALMEALAAQLAVIATDISGISELVVHEQTGLLVPEKDAAAIAGALERLRADGPLRAQLGEQGRAKVLQEFDLHSNTAALADRFRQAAVSIPG